MDLRDTPRCFVCGADNPSGLRVVFEVDWESRTISCRFRPRPEHEGWAGLVHGGIISALLDEAMVKLATRLGSPAVSAELTVKFKAPAATGDELLVRGRIVKDSGRLIEAAATVERSPVVIAEATGKLIKT